MGDVEAAYKKLQDESVRLLDEDDLDGAQPLVIESLARAKKLYGTKHVEVADCTYNLGSLQRRRGNVREALVTLKKALALQEALGKTQEESAARTLSDIANMLVGDRAYARAKPFAARAIAGFRACGVVDQDYAVALADYGKCCHEEGAFEEARKTYDEAIVRLEALELGEMATSARVSRGTASYRLGDFERAIDDYAIAYEAERKILPAGDDLDISRISLFDAKTAFACQEIDTGGDKVKARAAFEDALAIVEHDEPSERVVSALCNASSGAARTEDFTRAATLAQRAVEMARVLGSKTHLAIALYHRANTYVFVGESAKAVPLLEHAVEILKRAKVDSPARVVETHRLLGVALYEIDENARAAKAFREAIKLAKRHIGEDSDEVADAEECLAMALRDDDDEAAALPLLEKRLKKLATKVGRDHVDYADALEQMAHIVSSTDGPRAGPLYTEVIEIRERVAPASEDLVTAIGNLAIWHIDEDDGAGALPIAERALAVAIAAFGASHDVTADAWDTLARARLAAHMDESADDAFMHAIGLYEALHGVEEEETVSMIRDAAEAIEDEMNRCPRVAARFAALDSSAT